MKKIKITRNSCVFRGKTVFRGDELPEDGDHELTADELGIMVPRLAKLIGVDEPKPQTDQVKEASETPAKTKTETEKPAKKSAKKNG